MLFWEKLFRNFFFSFFFREDLPGTISFPLQVTDFRFVLDPFSVENQQLTQTLKVKRNIVERNHAQEIQEIFTS